MSEPVAPRRLAMTIPLGREALATLPARVRELEALGYSDLWTRETDEFDAFTPLAVAAGAGCGLRLGTGIAGVFSRGPAALAMSAAALADAAPGRFVLGLGVSSRTIVEAWNAGRYEAPYVRLRDTVRFLRSALAGERVRERYESFKIEGFRLERPPQAPPPIVLAALRERMLGLAGREADGAVLGVLTAADVAAVAPLVHAGGPGKEIVARIPVAVTEDAERARGAARRMFVPYLQVPVYARFQDWLGRAEVLAPMRRAWAAGDREAAFRAMDDELVDGLYVHGSAETCRAKLEAFYEAGVTTLIIALDPISDDLTTAPQSLAASP